MAARPVATLSLGEQIHEELTCSICLELFNKPKVLPCQHTFCQGCLQQLTLNKTTLFQCPVCSQWARKPCQGVKALPDNILVTTLQMRVQHQATPVKRKRESKDRCVLHQSEEIKLYCQQCDVPVCNECLDQNHSDHCTVSLKKAAQERKAPVQALVDEGKNNLARSCTFVKSLRDKERGLKEQTQQTKNNIISTYNQMVQKLTERRDCLLSEVEKIDNENMTMLQKERDSVLLDISKLAAACDRADEEMAKGGVVFLHQESILAGIMEKHRGNPAPSPVQNQSAVFQPIVTPVPVLGQVLVQARPNAQIPAAPAPVPAAPASCNDAPEAKPIQVCDESNNQPKTIIDGRKSSMVLHAVGF
uniref:RING-type domain-containing protein n=1 Tax=Branchiostoma floridae TaxID=7739 RepID=C3ZFE3_BRAFL|eukprot:XP_002592686.1 hypothetical protein BRAFLDRAFT_67125 [Branchiostoma floridae]